MVALFFFLLARTIIIPVRQTQCHSMGYSDRELEPSACLAPVGAVRLEVPGPIMGWMNHRATSASLKLRTSIVGRYDPFAVS